MQQRNKHGSTETNDDRYARSLCTQRLILYKVGGKMTRMNSQQDQSRHDDHQEHKNEITLPEKTQRKQVYQPDHRKKKDDPEDDIGYVDDIRRKIRPAASVDDIINKAQKCIGDADE